MSRQAKACSTYLHCLFLAVFGLYAQILLSPCTTIKANECPQMPERPPMSPRCQWTSWEMVRVSALRTRPKVALMVLCETHSSQVQLLTIAVTCKEKASRCLGCSLHNCHPTTKVRDHRAGKPHQFWQPSEAPNTCSYRPNINYLSR